MLVLMLQHVSSRVSGFPVASPCLWRKLQNLSCFKVPKQVVTWFCVAGVALCDIQTCLITCRKSFCVACTILLRPFQKMSCSFPALQTCRIACSSLHTPHSTLYTPYSTLCTPHLTFHTIHSTLHTLHSTLWILHSTLHTPHNTLHTLHFTLYTLQCKLHTLHSTLYTLNSTLYTPQFTLHTLHSTPNT